ncbi:MAG TPA: flagellar basal body-associated FliL family protein [Acidobacteriota bacterium]|nr:flagellar basal body-associated FliL family protein [Acidobacteriota bacterium]
MADEPIQNEAAKPKGSKLWILIAALIVLVTGDLAIRSLGYFKGSPRVESGGAVPSTPKTQSPLPARKGEVKSTMPLDPFLVNLADKEEIRFLKATFHLGLEEKSGEESKDPVSVAAMRDTIISILSSKTSDQILTNDGKDKLREEIRERLCSIAPKMKIQEVFIVEFVVQL